jgi:ribosomal protein L33
LGEIYSKLGLVSCTDFTILFLSTMNKRHPHSKSHLKKYHARINRHKHHVESFEPRSLLAGTGGDEGYFKHFPDVQDVLRSGLGHAKGAVDSAVDWFYNAPSIPSKLIDITEGLTKQSQHDPLVSKIAELEACPNRQAIVGIENLLTDDIKGNPLTVTKMRQELDILYKTVEGFDKEGSTFTAEAGEKCLKAATLIFEKYSEFSDKYDLPLDKRTWEFKDEYSKNAKGYVVTGNVKDMLKAISNNLKLLDGFADAIENKVMAKKLNGPVVSNTVEGILDLKGNAELNRLVEQFSTVKTTLGASGGGFGELLPGLKSVDLSKVVSVEKATEGLKTLFSGVKQVLNEKLYPAGYNSFVKESFFKDTYQEVKLKTESFGKPIIGINGANDKLQALDNNLEKQLHVVGDALKVAYENALTAVANELSTGNLTTDRAVERLKTLDKQVDSMLRSAVIVKNWYIDLVTFKEQLGLAASMIQHVAEAQEVLKALPPQELATIIQEAKDATLSLKNAGDLVTPENFLQGIAHSDNLKPDGRLDRVLGQLNGVVSGLAADLSHLDVEGLPRILVPTVIIPFSSDVIKTLGFDATVKTVFDLVAAKKNLEVQMKPLESQLAYKSGTASSWEAAAHGLSSLLSLDGLKGLQNKGIVAITNDWDWGALKLDQAKDTAIDTGKNTLNFVGKATDVVINKGYNLLKVPVTIDNGQNFFKVPVTNQSSF